METNLEAMKLTELKPEETATILQILGENDSAVRLHALGFLPGRTIRRKNTAPLGDPVAYEVDGQKIGIRLAEAALMEIEIS